MMLNRKLQTLLECKSGNDGHISQEPLILPCGFSICKSCYKSIIKCSQCQKEHIIEYETMKTNFLIKDMIKNHIKDLNLIGYVKHEEYSVKIDGIHNF
jgi:hypothetical protein